MTDADMSSHFLSCWPCSSVTVNYWVIFPFIGVKGGKKKGRNNTTVPKPQKLSNGNICVEFTCVPIKECTIPQCPPKYVLHTVHEKNNIKLKCPIYSCVPPAPPHATCKITGQTFHTFDGTEFKHDICNHILARDLKYDNWDISGKIVLIVKFKNVSTYKSIIWAEMVWFVCFSVQGLSQRDWCLQMASRCSTRWKWDPFLSRFECGF